MLTGKFALVLPAATVTLAGTVAAAGVSLDSVTTTPPVGAGLINVTVPVAGLPPSNEDGVRVTEATDNWTTDKEVWPLMEGVVRLVAVICAVPSATAVAVPD